MTATADQFIAALASQIGYREGRDPNGNWNNLNKFGAWYGANGVAWCAEFQSWGADQVGALWTSANPSNPNGLVPKYASCTAGLSWFRQRGQTGVWPPKKGDIFILCDYNPGAWNAQPNGWAPIHTGAVEKWVPDSSTNGETGVIVTIEGNTNDTGSAQGNGVYRLQRSDARTSNRIIYCRPKWAPSVIVRPPVQPPSRTDTRPPLPPIPGATYTGSRVIDASRVRPNARNTACQRFNGLLWAWLCKNDTAWARAHAAAWMAESANLYGKQGQLATQRAYAVIKQLGTVSLPTFPGPKLIKWIGGTPI